MHFMIHFSNTAEDFSNANWSEPRVFAQGYVMTNAVCCQMFRIFSVANLMAILDNVAILTDFSLKHVKVCLRSLASKKDGPWMPWVFTEAFMIAVAPMFSIIDVWHGMESSGVIKKV